MVNWKIPLKLYGFSVVTGITLVMIWMYLDMSIKGVYICRIHTNIFNEHYPELVIYITGLLSFLYTINVPIRRKKE